MASAWNLKGNSAPHSGQSSQLFSDTNDRLDRSLPLCLYRRHVKGRPCGGGLTSQSLCKLDLADLAFGPIIPRADSTCLEAFEGWRRTRLESNRNRGSSRQAALPNPALHSTYR